MEMIEEGTTHILKLHECELSDSSTIKFVSKTAESSAKLIVKGEFCSNFIVFYKFIAYKIILSRFTCRDEETIMENSLGVFIYTSYMQNLRLRFQNPWSPRPVKKWIESSSVAKLADQMQLYPGTMAARK